MTPIGKNADPSLSFGALLDRSDCVTAGIDGGGLDDLFGFAALGREKGPDEDIEEEEEEQSAEAADRAGRDDAEAPIWSRRWLLHVHAWAHVGVLERRKEIAPRLLDFARAGELTIFERVGDEVVQAADLVEQIRDAGRFPLKGAIGVDPAGIGAVLDELDARGIDTTPEAGFVVGVPQGWKLQTAIKTTERKLAGGDLVHSGGLLLPWCAGNARVEPRANGILITKQASGFAKIDPLMAAFNAVALMAMNPASPTSIYDTEKRGFLVL